MESARQWLRAYQCSLCTRTDYSSLAAYGIDPAAAVVEEMPEDGGVEEEDDDDSDSDSDDDDVKLVFTGGPQRTLDLRFVTCFYSSYQPENLRLRRPMSLESVNGRTRQLRMHQQLPLQ